MDKTLFDPFKIPDTPMICGEWYSWWRRAEPIFREWKEGAEANSYGNTEAKQAKPTRVSLRPEILEPEEEAGH